MPTITVKTCEEKKCVHPGVHVDLPTYAMQGAPYKGKTGVQVVDVEVPDYMLDQDGALHDDVFGALYKGSAFAEKGIVREDVEE